MHFLKPPQGGFWFICCDGRMAKVLILTTLFKDVG